jgi:hypothetical protein
MAEAARPTLAEMLNEHVSRLLADAAIPEQVLDEMPYTVASAHEFEVTSQIIAQVGIFCLMNKKTASGQNRWSLLPFVYAEFKEEMRRINWHLFASDWARLIPDAPDAWVSATGMVPRTSDRLREAISGEQPKLPI